MRADLPGVDRIHPLGSGLHFATTEKPASDMLSKILHNFRNGSVHGGELVKERICLSLATRNGLLIQMISNLHIEKRVHIAEEAGSLGASSELVEVTRFSIEEDDGKVI